MPQVIDCLFIGHNEMDFVDYEKDIRKMGIQSGAYRDLNLNFIQYNNTPYSASDIFNLFYLNDNHPGEALKPLILGETFNAAIAYLGTYLKRRELSFDYVNSFQDCKEELAEKLQQENLRTIAVITTLYVSVFPIFEIMDFIKKYNRTARVIVGGPFVSSHCRKMSDLSLAYLFKSIDADIYVNSAQGEDTLVKIINALKNNESLAKINNIYYKSNGKYQATAILEENNNLSENMVDWDLFSHRVGEYAAVRTSISCPFSCAFCAFPQHAGPYRTADVEAIETEWNRLAKIKSLKCIHIIDDTFNVPVKRFKKILSTMIKNNHQFHWNSHFRCQFADRESVELMKASGCEGVFLGIESGSPQILKNMDKASTVDQYLKGIALLKEYGILTHGSFIIGFPGETDETVHATIQFIKESGLDFCGVQSWYYDVLTPIRKKKAEFKIKGSNFEWAHAAMDSKRASDLVEEVFLSIKSSTWVPQYNFEFGSLFHLSHRGFTTEQLKAFLNAFNNGVKEKLTASSPKDIGFNSLMQLKKACQGAKPGHDLSTSEGIKSNRSTVEFDF